MSNLITRLPGLARSSAEITRKLATAAQPNRNPQIQHTQVFNFYSK